MRVVIGLVVVAAIFSGIEAMLPSHAPRRSLWDRRVDLPWWGLQPLAKAASKGVLAVLVGVPLVLFGFLVPGETWRGTGPVAALPAPAQLALVLLLSDGLGYLSHRFLFHRVPWAWRLHTVHHAPEVLDWAAAARVHPLNTLLNQVVHVVPLVPLGFDPVVIVGAAPLLTLWALFLHTDVAWRPGLLGRLVATPAFHRWHHARTDGSGCNFSGLFPLWDLLGGTFYLPLAPPMALGVHEPVPRSFLDALAWPLRRADR